jgi:hypothetical protein
MTRRESPPVSLVLKRGLQPRYQNCKEKFRPRRADALFCSDMCKQARHQMNNKKRQEIITFEIKQKRQEEALQAIGQFEQYQSTAGILHETAWKLGYDVKFLASRIGVLALEGPQSTPESIFWLRDRMRWWRKVDTKSDDRELTALLSIHTLYGKYLAVEAERHFRRALARGPANVTVFLWDDDYAAEQIKAEATTVSISRDEPVWPRSDYVELDALDGW